MTPAEAVAQAIGHPGATLHDNGWSVDPNGTILIPADTDCGTTTVVVTITITLPE